MPLQSRSVRIHIPMRGFTIDARFSDANGKPTTIIDTFEFILRIAELVYARHPTRWQVKQIFLDAQEELQTRNYAINDVVYWHLVKVAVRHGHATLVPRLLYVASRLHVHFSTRFYEDVCIFLAQENHWDVLSRVLVHYRWSAPLRGWSDRMLNWQLRLLLRRKRYDALTLPQVLEYFNAKDIKPNQRTYLIVARGHLENHDMSNARAVLDAMGQAGFPVDQRTCKVILGGLVALGPDAGVESSMLATLKGLDPGVDTVILNSLLILRSKAADRATFQMYLSFVAPSDPQQQPRRIPEWLRITPDVETFRILIDHFTEWRDFEAAERSFRLILDSGLQPNGAATAALLRAQFANKRPELAISIMAELLSDNRRVNRGVFMSMIQGTAESPYKLAGVVKPSTLLFNSFLTGLLPTCGLSAFSSILSLMQSCQLTPDEETLHRFLHHLESYESLNSSELIHVLYRFTQMKHLRNIRPSIRHVNVILHALLKEWARSTRPLGWKASAAYLAKGRHPNGGRLAWKARESMGSERLMRAFALVDNESAEKDIAVSYPASQGRGDQQLAKPNAPLRQLELIVEWLQQTGVRGDKATWGLRLVYHARVLQDMPGSERLYRQMMKAGIRPDPYHVSAIIEGYCAAGMLQEAETMLGAARQNRIATRHHYSMVICALGNAKDPKAGYRLFNQMLVDGVTPDFASVEAVVRGHFLLRQYESAKRFLLGLWPQVVPQGVPGVMLKLDPAWEGRISTTNLHDMDILRRKTLRELLMIFREIEDAMRVRPNTDPYARWRYRTDWRYLRDRATLNAQQRHGEAEDPAFPVIRTSSAVDSPSLRNVDGRSRLPPGQVYEGIFKNLAREWERTGRALHPPGTVPVEAVQRMRDDLRRAVQDGDICEDGSERILTDCRKAGDREYDEGESMVGASG